MQWPDRYELSGWLISATHAPGRVWVRIANPGNEIKPEQSFDLTFRKKLRDVTQKLGDFFVAFALSCFPKTRGMNPDRPTICGVHVGPLHILAIRQVGEQTRRNAIAHSSMAASEGPEMQLLTH
jgi:hypothetical protein